MFHIFLSIYWQAQNWIGQKCQTWGNYVSYERSCYTNIVGDRYWCTSAGICGESSGLAYRQGLSERRRPLLCGKLLYSSMVLRWWSFAPVRQLSTMTIMQPTRLVRGALGATWIIYTSKLCSLTCSTFSDVEKYRRKLQAKRPSRSLTRNRAIPQ